MGQVNCLSTSATAQPEHISLEQYALNRGFILDTSRRQFCERMNTNLIRLVTNELERRNRFRELLLGVKAVGKTYLLEIVRNYVSVYYPTVLTIYQSFDNCKKSLKDVIVESIRFRLGRLSRYRLDEILVAYDDDFVSFFCEMEILLANNSVKILLLLDEFHFVYKNPGDIGRETVRQLSTISGSNLGVFHVVVSGSSSV